MNQQEMQYEPLDQMDEEWVLRRLPHVVRVALKYFPATFLGGGFIRDTIGQGDPTDIDIFAPEFGIAVNFSNYIKDLLSDSSDKPWGGREIKTANALTLRHPKLPLPVQVIHRWPFRNPVELLESFDFTVCQAGIAWSGCSVSSSWKSFCSPRFYQDLAARRLIYTNPERIEETGGSMLRVLKFTRKGYNITLKSLAGVAARWMSGVDPWRLENRLGDLDEQPTAVVLRALLVEVDPSEISEDNTVDQIGE